MARIYTRYERGSVYVRCTEIYSMVIAKSHSLTRQLPERRSVFSAHEIRPHSIPNNNHHMSLGFGGCRPKARNVSTKNQRQDEAEYAIFTSRIHDRPETTPMLL